ncbi:MAG: hypothetical protein Kow001_01590 [Acidobacteriota bacterium]
MKPTGPGQSAFLLCSLVPCLDDLGIAYGVIGALAASFHGVPRSSLDADAVLALTGVPQGVERLASKFENLGMQVRVVRGDAEDPVQGLIQVTDSFGNRVDFLTGLRGLAPDFTTRTIPAPVAGCTLRIVGLEDFVAMKLFAGGPKDLQDAAEACLVSGANLQLDLLRTLTANYGRETLERLDRLLSQLDRR